MSLSSGIKTSYLKRQGVVEKTRPVILKRPEQFSKILLVLDEQNDELVKHAAMNFKNAEISQLFLRNKKEDNSQQFQYAVHPADFNLTGRLKNDKLSNLLGYEFDLILDLSSDTVYTDFFLRNLKSTLVIGAMRETIHDRFDLFFEYNQDKIAFVNLAIKQLNKLTQHGSE